MGSQITESELLSCFSNLLQDNEPEVRAGSTKNLPGYVTIVKSELFGTEIIPLLSSLAEDTAPNVRSKSMLTFLAISGNLWIIFD